MDRKTKGTITSVIVAALALTALAIPAGAQRTTTTRPAASAARAAGGAEKKSSGVMLSAYTLVAPGITIDGPDMNAGAFTTNMGYGAGVMVGYAFTPTITGFASLDLAKQGTNVWWATGSVGLSHFEAGVRAELPMGSPTTTPYVLGSFGRRAIGGMVEDEEFGDTYDLTVSGTAFSFGGGVEHVISPHVSLDGGISLGMGKFTHVSEGGEGESINVNGTTSMRFRFGVNWRP